MHLLKLCASTQDAKYILSPSGWATMSIMGKYYAQFAKLELVEPIRILDHWRYKEVSIAKFIRWHRGTSLLSPHSLSTRRLSIRVRLSPC